MAILLRSLGLIFFLPVLFGLNVINIFFCSRARIVLHSLSWVVQRLHLLVGLLGFSMVPVLVSRYHVIMHLMCWQETCACCPLPVTPAVLMPSIVVAFFSGLQSRFVAGGSIACGLSWLHMLGLGLHMCLLLGRCM